MTRKPPTPIGLSVEKVHAALEACNGSQTEAARILGVARNTIIYWSKKGNLRKIVTVEGDR